MYLREACAGKRAGSILNAQLIDTRTNAHIWTEEYDRDLKDVFALQSEIAQKVANRFGAQVSSVEKAAIEEPPTTDLVAYDRYLRAKDLINGITFSPRAKEDLFQAVELLEQAVARDPSFAMPMMSWPGRTTKFISSVSITLMRVFNWPKQPFNPFAACVLNLERHIWPSLITFTGPIGITTKPRRSWLSQGARCRTNHEFPLCLATLTGGKATGRNPSRK